MQGPLDRKIKLGFGLAVTVLAAILITTLWLNARRRDSNHALSHSHIVLIQIEHLRLEISRTENQLRGYLLTGEPKFREDFAVASADTERCLIQLGELTADTPEQQRNMEQVRSQLQQLEASREIALQLYPQHELMQQRMLSPQAQAQSESTERSINVLEREENELQQQHTEHWKSKSRSSSLISLMLSVALFGLLRLLYKSAREDAALRRANADLLLEAMTDGLTGLKNRRAFEKQLNLDFQRAARYGRPLACLLLDVDRFKQFNDTYGHPAGDLALQQVATIIQANARLSDFAARHGGEEFAILLPETDAPGALDAAERLRSAIAEYPWTQSPLTVSIGVACLNPESESAAMFMQHVDQALYTAKAFGRDRVEFFDLLTTPLSDEILVQIQASQPRKEMLSSELYLGRGL